MNDIERHFENLRVALVMALQRGVFSDFETATQIKFSMDAVGMFLKQSQNPLVPAADKKMPDTNGVEQPAAENKVSQQ